MRYFDNVLPPEKQRAVLDYVRAPGWEWGWKSNVNKDVYQFWHKHYAGHVKLKDDAYDCAEELKQKHELLWKFWRHLGPYLPGHKLVRCYANGHAYGIDGTLHYDSKNPNSFTAVYYPHLQWSPNWGGETVFFNKEETDLIWSVYPKPNRLVVFPGTVPHAARGVSRTCPVLRATLMFKTELCSPPTKTS